MPRGRHRHSPPLHRLLPPSAIAGVSLVCALGPWVFTEPAVLRSLAAAAAATAVVGAVVLRHWDIQAGKRVADLTRGRASDEWRFEERVAELETDLEESRELRGKLEQRLRAKRTELAKLRNEHAALLRRYATAEADRASVLEERRVLEIEATAPVRTALPAGTTEAAGAPAAGAEALTAEEQQPGIPAVFSPEGTRLFLRAKAALARFDAETVPDPDGGGDGDGDGVPKAEETEPVRDGATDERPEQQREDEPQGQPETAAGGERPAAGDESVAAGGERAAAGDERVAAGGDRVAAGGEPATAGSERVAAGAEGVAAGNNPSTASNERPAVGKEPATAGAPGATKSESLGQAASQGHYTVPTAVAVAPQAPVRRPQAEGGFDFFGTKQGTSRATLEAVQNEDLADVVGPEALALHKAETEARFKPADEGARAVGQVIDLTAHDETEQIDVQGLRSAVS